MTRHILHTVLLAIFASLFAWSAAASDVQQPVARTTEAAPHSAIARDWMLQDYMNISLPEDLEREKRQWRDQHLQAAESRPDAPVLKHLSCFVSSQDSVVEQRMIAHVAEELGEEAAEIRDAARLLATAAVSGNDPRWRKLYLRACHLRRGRRLTPLLSRWNQFVFNQHQHIPTSWKYTEGLSDAHRYRFFSPGASLNVLEMKGQFGQVRTLLEDPAGTIRNPDVSFDGRRLLFAWKKSDRDDDYHLYEMELATRKIRQLTEGEQLADYEGIYLPDGNILFNSTRCVQSVDCNWVEVSNFYLMDAGGASIRRIAFDQVHTIFPTLTDDGRVLYTRWEYSDRGQIYPQPLFQMNPDGTNQRELYGNNSWFPTNIIHARKIPGSRKVLAIVTGHHMPAYGKLAIIDPAVGRQEGQGVQLIAPVRKTDPIKIDRYGLGGNYFQYPYPVDEQRFLVTLALPTPDGQLGRFNIYFMDVDGRRELLVQGRETGHGVGCRQILPLAPRPMPHVRASGVDYARDTGTFYLQDVYHGLAVAGVPRGSIKRLRIVALKYRCGAIGEITQNGLGGHSSVTTPIAIGNGSWDVKEVLGSTPVFEDGSAFFEVPARTPVYFQALDEKNRAVQTMRSWTTLMPGENQSCVGCHEHKNSTPRSQPGVSLAMRAGPQELTPFYGPTRGFSFPAEIQPILDRHCVRCHNDAADEGVAPNLTGDMVDFPKVKRNFSRSYLALTHTSNVNGDWNHPMVNWIDCMSEPSLLPPYHRGAATSKLLTLLEDGHEGARLDEEEMEKIACWIDLLVPYCGDYLEANTWSPSERRYYERMADKRKGIEATEREAVRALVD